MRRTGMTAAGAFRGSIRSRRKGFTLIEVLIAAVILAIGITALVSSVGAGSRMNGAGIELSNACLLAQEIREWTLRLPFKNPDPAKAANPPGPDGTNPQVTIVDLNDLYNPDGLTYSPPRSAFGLPAGDSTSSRLDAMAGWSQTIYLTWRNPRNLAAVVTAGTSDVVRVEVVIKRHDKEVLRTSWLVTNRDKY